MKRISKINISILILIVWALITLLLTFVLKANNQIAENFYAQGIYPLLAFVMSSISSLFSFSLADVLYILLVLYIPGCIILMAKKKLKWKSFLKSFVSIIAIVYISFYWMWGFNYFRQNIHERLELSKTEPSSEVFKLVMEEVIEHVNTSYIKVDSVNVQDFQVLHEKCFSELAENLKLNYPLGKRRVKYITFSNWFAKATIGGYYGPFFNEIHVNKYLSNWDVPMVVAHEMSHQFGITGEAEANFYAWMICANSKDEFARYSGWLFVLNNFLYQAGEIYTKEELLSKLKPEVIDDLKSRRKHWLKLRVRSIDKVANKVNDAYLKSNNVEKGIKDYNAVVQLVIDMHQDKGGF